MLPACCPQGKQARLRRVQLGGIMVDKPFELADRAGGLACFDQGPFNSLRRRPRRNRQRVIRRFEPRQAADPFGGPCRLGQRILHTRLLEYGFCLAHGLGHPLGLHQQRSPLGQYRCLPRLGRKTGQFGNGLGQPVTLFDRLGVGLFQFLSARTGLGHGRIRRRTCRQQGFIACKLIQQSPMRRRLQQRGCGVLAMDFDQEVADFGQQRRADRLVIQEGAGRPVAAQDALQGQCLVGGSVNARLVQRRPDRMIDRR